MFIIIRCKWVIPTLITIYNFNPIFISNSHNYIFQTIYFNDLDILALVKYDDFNHNFINNINWLKAI